MNYYLSVLKNYSNFDGRARRSEYWYFFLFNIIIGFGIGIIGGLMDSTLLGNLYCLAVLIPGIAVGVRRMHDIGKSGWYILIPFYSLYLVCSDGDQGSNEYGPDPKVMAIA